MLEQQNSGLITHAPSQINTVNATRKINKLWFFIGLLLLLASISTSWYFYQKYVSLKDNSSANAMEEVKSVVATVGKLIALPTDEQPTLATVTDPEKLQRQPFFAAAKKGDKVLIYTNAKKAILYNPTENKIIEVAPLNIGAGSESEVSGANTQKTSDLNTK